MFLNLIVLKSSWKFESAKLPIKEDLELSLKIFTTMVPSMAFAIGELILTLQAYFIRDWFTLQVINFQKVPFVYHFIEKFDRFFVIFTTYSSETTFYHFPTNSKPLV